MKFETHAIAGFHRRPNSIASSFPLMSAINCGLKDLLISDDIEDQGGRWTLQPPITEDRRRPLFFLEINTILGTCYVGLTTKNPSSRFAAHGRFIDNPFSPNHRRSIYLYIYIYNIYMKMEVTRNILTINNTKLVNI